MSEDVTALLAGIKERRASRAEHAPGMGAPAADFDRLVKAVEAVLAQHQPGRVAIIGVVCKRHEAHRNFSIDAREAADVRACPDCMATVYASCTGCATGVSVDACPVRGAITRALTGTPEPVIDLGYMSLPAELQAAIEKGVVGDE